ncbi:hypothetical protein WH50_13985 [Pokkaliibacter plantistimulans]|uniref:Uncharacterized protein n=2 Tax=Pokkaliibacter plantistimulans TaxID=1635171 RepID=A0ABX5LVK1_9GAMM|nr:hypothetical protein WH50_13985 [Pokkaliibacter plantistimulans]
MMRKNNENPEKETTDRIFERYIRNLQDIDNKKIENLTDVLDFFDDVSFLYQLIKSIGLDNFNSRVNEANLLRLRAAFMNIEVSSNDMRKFIESITGNTSDNL